MDYPHHIIVDLMDHLERKRDETIQLALVGSEVGGWARCVCMDKDSVPCRWDKCIYNRC